MSSVLPISEFLDNGNGKPHWAIPKVRNINCKIMVKQLCIWVPAYFTIRSRSRRCVSGNLTNSESAESKSFKFLLIFIIQCATKIRTRRSFMVPANWGHSHMEQQVFVFFQARYFYLWGNPISQSKLLFCMITVNYVVDNSTELVPDASVQDFWSNTFVISSGCLNFNQLPSKRSCVTVVLCVNTR